MLFVYPAIFHKEEDAYWVEFPDLEGCYSYGSSVNETMEAAQEALAAYLLTLLEQKKTIAAPYRDKLFTGITRSSSLQNTSIIFNQQPRFHIESGLLLIYYSIDCFSGILNFYSRKSPILPRCFPRE